MTCSCCSWGSQDGPLCSVCEHAHKVAALFYATQEKHHAFHAEDRTRFRMQVEALTDEQWAELTAALEKISKKTP